MKMFALLAALIAAPLWAQAPPPVAAPAGHDPDICDGKPVIMVVAGLINDRARIIAYGAAIRDAGLYEKLGGYYLNSPRPLAVFEGAPPANASTLMVRFPCFAHARAFWYSRTYQEKLVPLRQNPSAGDFTVTVYPEIAAPPAVAAMLAPGGYTVVPDAGVAASIPQVTGKPNIGPKTQLAPAPGAWSRGLFALVTQRGQYWRRRITGGKLRQRLSPAHTHMPPRTLTGAERCSEKYGRSEISAGGGIFTPGMARPRKGA